VSIAEPPEGPDRASRQRRDPILHGLRDWAWSLQDAIWAAEARTDWTLPELRRRLAQIQALIADERNSVLPQKPLARIENLDRLETARPEAPDAEPAHAEADRREAA